MELEYYLEKEASDAGFCAVCGVAYSAGMELGGHFRNVLLGNSVKSARANEGAYLLRKAPGIVYLEKQIETTLEIVKIKHGQHFSALLILFGYEIFAFPDKTSVFVVSAVHKSVNSVFYMCALKGVKASF